MASPDFVLEIDGLTKSFGQRTVVSNISFQVRRGEIFGFLGPNGSGKTTTIRMALGIIRPDSGTISILGSDPSRTVLKRVGYLPEDRGLLRKVRVLDIVRYLGRLKGLSSSDAEERGTELLHRVGLFQHRHKRVEGLSRGMTQLIQFISAIIHEPEFIILDEPFAGLDPLNVQLMKQMLFEQQERGATIMFSTHIMSDVEELCQRVALIADSHMLIYGDLDEIKRDRGASAVRVRAPEMPRSLGQGRAAPVNGIMEFAIGDGRTSESVLRAFLDAGIPVERFELLLPTMNDVFIEEVSRARNLT
ncbi:MAG: ATP-binding cassette domain-containing protein [Chloroflexi bacterium]|nr:ATP-binding cassette domain-containing protein [Chloroflexota bacterium]MDA1297789.1 ATP-binding cassette domain-containing protein [Chloroflexota bacterium]